MMSVANAPVVAGVVATSEGDPVPLAPRPDPLPEALADPLPESLTDVSNWTKASCGGWHAMSTRRAWEPARIVSHIQFPNAASSGSIVNQVQRDYNGLGQLITEYQAHRGAVNTGSTPRTCY
jgi:hypothetical protein